MRAPLTIAAAQPRCRPMDVRANALAHADLIRTAHARLVVFPELSLTDHELHGSSLQQSGRSTRHRSRNGAFASASEDVS